jgi:hypothetical protein
VEGSAGQRAPDQPVFLDEVGLQGCGDFVGRLQRVVDGPVRAVSSTIAPLRASGVLGTHLATRLSGPVVFPAALASILALAAISGQSFGRHQVVLAT